MDLNLKGKRALITGASKGIGLAVAHVLAEEGCDLDLAARNGELLSQVAADLQRRYDIKVRSFSADLGSANDQGMLSSACANADILVNNAGSNPPGEINEISEDIWRASWDLKVFGYINMTRAFYSQMKIRGEGVILNIIGNSGERMAAKYILGSAGNIALMGLTRALGGRSPDHGVRVLGVNPGLTNTDRAERMLKGWSANAQGSTDRWQEYLAELDLPFGRMGEAREVADLVAFLVSPRASYISGTIVTIDGGAVNRNS
jgi:NAD(P)-dependent dehydrogenase (short-subunit alcohol dehydrogenase family)